MNTSLGSSKYFSSSHDFSGMYYGSDDQSTNPGEGPWCGFELPSCAVGHCADGDVESSASIFDTTNLIDAPSLYLLLQTSTTGTTWISRTAARICTVGR